MSTDQLSSGSPPGCLESIEGAIAAELPIHSIPAEILSEVFVRLADSCRPIDKGPFPGTRSEHNWRPVMSVCRFWRDTALHTPSLWNTITLDDNDMPSKWTKLVMERSRHSLLHLDIPYVVRDVSVFGHAAFQQWHRIQSIALRAHSFRDLRKIETYLPSELPSLESIEVHHWSRMNSDAGHDFPVDSQYAHALEVLVQAAGPKLARVAVTGLKISTTLLTSLPGLKSLSISSPLNMTSWSPVLGLLAGLPGLESFVFVFSERAAQEEGSVAAQHVHLSNLRYLDVTSSSLTACTFLNSLSYPSTATTIVRSRWSREATLPPSNPDTNWSLYQNFWGKFDRDIATSFTGVTANMAEPTSMSPIRSFSLRARPKRSESRRTNVARVRTVESVLYHSVQGDHPLLPMLPLAFPRLSSMVDRDPRTDLLLEVWPYDLGEEIRDTTVRPMRVIEVLGHIPKATALLLMTHILKAFQLESCKTLHIVDSEWPKSRREHIGFALLEARAVNVETLSFENGRVKDVRAFVEPRYRQDGLELLTPFPKLKHLKLIDVSLPPRNDADVPGSRKFTGMLQLQESPEVPIRRLLKRLGRRRN